MYTPAHHAQTDLAAQHALMRAHPLAAVVTPGADGLVADHLPLHLDASAGAFGTLRGHVARANPVWRRWEAGAAECLVIFQGPHAYITPNWYPSKAEHGKAVPTWDYLAVHAHGTPRLLHDEARVRVLLESLTDTHEARQAAAPWRVSDAPADYLAKMLRAIVAFELPIARLQARWKHSQRDRADDRAGTQAGLRARGTGHDLALAAQMQQHEARQASSNEKTPT